MWKFLAPHQKGKIEKKKEKKEEVKNEILPLTIPISPHLYKEFKLTTFSLPQVLKVQLLAIELMDFTAEDIFRVVPPLRYFYNTFYERLAKEYEGETNQDSEIFQFLKNEVRNTLISINVEKDHDYNHDHLWGYLVRKSFKRGQLFEERSREIMNNFLNKLQEIIKKNLFCHEKMRETNQKNIPNDKTDRKKSKNKRKKESRSPSSHQHEHYEIFLKSYTEDLEVIRSQEKKPQDYDFLGIDKSAIQESLLGLMKELIENNQIETAQVIHNFFYITGRIYRENTIDKERLVNLISPTLCQGLRFNGKFIKYPEEPIPKTYPRTLCYAELFENGVMKRIFEVTLTMNVFQASFKKKPIEDKTLLNDTLHNKFERLNVSQQVPLKGRPIIPQFKRGQSQIITMPTKEKKKNIEEEQEQEKKIEDERGTPTVNRLRTSSEKNIKKIIN